MALDAEILGTAQFQVSLEIGPMRVVAGNAGRHLVRPRINDRIADGMAELALVLMTLHAYRDCVAFQQRHIIRTMQVMADAAFPQVVFMDILLLAVFCHGIGMAVSADEVLAASQQFISVACVWAVADRATLIIHRHQVIVEFLHLAFYLIMTA